MEKLRAQLVEKNVANLRRLGRKFRIMDDDRSGSLSLEEFTKGIRDMGINMSFEEISAVMKTLDKDGSGSLNIDEFLEAARPPMSEYRKNLIEAVFKKADKSGDGFITPVDLKGVFNVSWNPAFKSGKKTEEQLFEEFLNTFEPDQATRDGKVTLAEFMSYYASIGQAFPEDADFEEMMKSYWGV
ncbi:calcyphosin-like [Asterias amurensis]|uniref:calcyphosin-like n=1 Tax=Asterias amurensis TaxID=7602 RepID=UPI003AB5244B